MNRFDEMLKKLILIFASSFSLSMVLADESNVADAFANGKFSGVFQSYYFEKFSEVDAKDHSITTFGLDLSYETEKFQGFGLKTTIQNTYSPWVSDLC